MGGYLGLLLGHSIYSFYNVVADWLRNRRDTFCGSGKKNMDEDLKHKSAVATKVETF